MSIEKFTPIRTSYKDIVFRSKSEAIFARALDLANEKKNNVSLAWEYEPESYRFRDYVPDFLIASKFDDENLAITLVEYKPSAPSDAYLEKFEEAARFYASIKQPIRAALQLTYGSPYNKTYGLYTIRDGELIHMEDAWWCGVHVLADEAKTHRFDLAQGAA